MARRRYFGAAFFLSLLLSLTAPAVAADLYGGGSDLDGELRGLLTSPEAEKRRAGIEQLAGIEPRRAIPHLMTALHDVDASVRARAAHALGPSAVLEAAPLLLGCLSDADSGVRSACAEALGQYGTLPAELLSRTAAGLGRALGDSQYEVRMEALRAIERLLRSRSLGLPEAQHLLGPVLLRIEDEHVGVRRAAAAALGRLSPLGLPKELLRRAVVALLGRLSDAARDVRAEAVASLSALSAAEAAPAAVRLCQDPAEEVRRQALLYLGRVGYAPAVPLLIDTFESGSESLRGAAAQSLGTLGRTSGAAAARATLALVAGLDREELRAESREALLQIGSAAAPALLLRLQKGATTQAEVSAVVDLLRDLGAAVKSSPPALRAQVTDELFIELKRGRLPREQVIDALAAQADPAIAQKLSLLLSEPEVAVRRHAIAGLKQPGLLDGRAVDALLFATRDGDQEVRTQAVLLLAELPAAATQSRGPVFLRLVELLRAGDFETRLAAAQALTRSAERGVLLPLDEGALAAVLTALTAPGDSLSALRLRRATAQALGQLVIVQSALRPRLVTTLVGLLRAGRSVMPEVVTALGNVLRGAMGELKGKEAETVRRTLLDLASMNGADSDSSESVLAVESLDALAALRDSDTAGRLARLVSHREPLRRMRAVAALGNLASLGNDSVVSVILSSLREDADSRVVAEAAWALGKLPRGSSSVSRAVTALRQVLDRREGGAEASQEVGYGGSQRGVRVNVLAALTRLGQAEVGDAQWLSDADPGVRANAALLLSTLKERSAGMLSRLRNLANSDEDHRVRENAERALSGPFSTNANDRRHFLSMFQMDHDRKPLSENAYRLTLPDGLVRIGVTDRRGVAREELVPPGTCAVELLSELYR